MKICVCGGGNLGHVVSGFLALQPDNEVCVLTRSPERWSQSLCLVFPDGKEKTARLEKVSANPAEVVSGSNVVILTLPGFAIADELLRIKPHIGQAAVGSVVCSTGFFFQAHDILEPQTPLFGFQRVPFISRIADYGHRAELKGFKNRLFLAAECMDDAEAFCKWAEQSFATPVSLLGSHLEASLSNSNPLLHPARLFTMWRDWEPGKVYERNPFFYEDWTDQASRCYVEMDSEFQQLLRKVGIAKDAIPPVLDYYGQDSPEKLTEKMRSISAFKGILSPMVSAGSGFVPDFRSRYFTEDFPYGLHFIADLCKKHGISAPLINEVYDWGTACIARYSK